MVDNRCVEVVQLMAHHSDLHIVQFTVEPPYSEHQGDQRKWRCSKYKTEGNLKFILSKSVQNIEVFTV